MPGYADVFRSERAVRKYADVVYEPGSYGTAVDARQRRVVRSLVRARFPGQRPTQHDFATGTGRAIDMLAGLVDTAHGYDVSEAMLADAAATHAARGATVGRVQWHLVEADGPVPRPVVGDGPVVVTVFRLLLNAPPEARQRAIAFAALALPDAGSGVLLVENHGHRRSLRHLSRRLNSGNPWYRELSDQEVTELLAGHGFRVVSRRGCAVLPPGWYRSVRLRPLVRRLDDFLCASRLFDRWAVDVIYVAVRVR